MSVVKLCIFYVLEKVKFCNTETVLIFQADQATVIYQVDSYLLVSFEMNLS